MTNVLLWMINGVTWWIILQSPPHEPRRELAVIIWNAGFSFFFCLKYVKANINVCEDPRRRGAGQKATIRLFSLCTNVPHRLSCSFARLTRKTAAPFLKMWWKSDKCANLCPLRCSLWMRWGKVTHFLMKPLWNWSNYSDGGQGGGWGGFHNESFWKRNDAALFFSPPLTNFSLSDVSRSVPRSKDELTSLRHGWLCSRSHVWMERQIYRKITTERQ